MCVDRGGAGLEPAGAGHWGLSHGGGTGPPASVGSLRRPWEWPQGASDDPASCQPARRCPRQPLSLSMSRTAHRPCFFRKLFFPFSLSMETQNSNQKKKKKRSSSLPACRAVTEEAPGEGGGVRRPLNQPSHWALGAGHPWGVGRSEWCVCFRMREAGFPRGFEFILLSVTQRLKRRPLSVWRWSGGPECP